MEDLRGASLRSPGWRWLGAPGGPGKSQRGIAGQSRCGCNKRGRGLGEGQGRGPRCLLNDPAHQTLRTSGFVVLFFNCLFLDPAIVMDSLFSLSLASLSLLLHSCRTLRSMEGKKKQTGYLPLEGELEWADPEHYIETVLYGEKCPG